MVSNILAIYFKVGSFFCKTENFFSPLIRAGGAAGNRPGLASIAERRSPIRRVSGQNSMPAGSETGAPGAGSLLERAVAATREIARAGIGQLEQVRHREVGVDGNPVQQVRATLQNISLARHAEKVQLKLSVRREADRRELHRLDDEQRTDGHAVDVAGRKRAGREREVARERQWRGVEE